MIDIRQFATDPLAFFNALVIPSAHGPRPFAEVLADHQRNWFKALAPSLVAIANSKTPPTGRFWTERTKGGSKDSDAACVLLWLLAFSRQKLDMQVGAADRDQALELKKAACDILRLNDWLATRIEVQAWSLLCRATGSECTIVAADIAGSHGARPDVVVLNELSHVTKEEFASNLLDNATKKPNGLVIVATNAGFSGSWQHNWREMARQSSRWHFHQLAEPAPWLSEDELEEAARRNSHSRFERLFWGRWVSQSGDALDESDIQAAIDSSLKPATSKQAGWVYLAGLDLGVKQDHSALVVIAANRSTQTLRLAHAQSWQPNPTTRKVNLIDVEREVLGAHRRFGLLKCGFDPFQAALMAQRLELQQVPMHEVAFTGANLNTMASTLLDVFRSRRIELYDCPQLIADLRRLNIEEKSYGFRLAATRDENGHADLATALAIALPLAVDAVGQVPPVVGAIDLNDGQDDSLTPFQRALARFNEDAAEYAEYARALDRLSDADDGQGDWRYAMRAFGRL